MSKAVLSVKTDPGASAQVFGGLLTRTARASTASIAEVGEIIKTRGRASIGAAGFSARWQNALRVNLYPQSGKPSVNAAAFVYHKIPYAAIFEYGGTIAGRPMLWIPIKGGGADKSPRLTPRQFAAKVAPLQYVKGRRAPLLVRKAPPKKRDEYSKMFPGKLRANGVDGRPVFFGVPVVSVAKKFNIIGAVEEGRGRLPAIFTRNLGAGNG